MMTNQQVHIREHLVPFLYQEFDGVERVFSGRKVKVVRITNKSSLGKWLTAMLEHTNKEIKVSNYNIYLSIDDREHRSEEHTSELQSRGHVVCRLLLEKKKCVQQFNDQ